METSLTLKVSELDESLLQVLRQLFRRDREVTLTVTSATDFELNEPETKGAYITRIQAAIANVDAGKTAVYTEEQLDTLAFDRLKR